MTLPTNDVPATPASQDEPSHRELSNEALETVVAGTGSPSPEPLLPPHFPLPA